jgi:hypothetical protein
MVTTALPRWPSNRARTGRRAHWPAQSPWSCALRQFQRDGPEQHVEDPKDLWRVRINIEVPLQSPFSTEKTTASTTPGASGAKLLSERLRRQM